MKSGESLVACVILYSLREGGYCLVQIFGNKSGVIAQWISVIVGSIAIWSTWPKSEPSLPLQGIATVKPYLLPALFAIAIVLAALLHLIASRKSGDGRKPEDTALGSATALPGQSTTDKALIESQERVKQLEQAHESCERTISNHESTIRRLTEHNQTQGIQISARDTQIEQMEAQLSELKTSPYELVHRVADHQAKNIRDFVTVSRVAVWEHNLNDPVPTIKWGFMVQNRSLFPINLVEVRNNLFFESTELAERRFDPYNEVEQLPYWRDGSVIYEQRLSGPEAQYIKSKPDGKFRFNRLIIKVGNPNTYPVIEPQELIVTDDLETTLNVITYKETEGMKSLKKEIVRLKQQAEKLTAQPQKEGLTLDIDEERTKVMISGHSADSRTYQVEAWLRCFKVGNSKLAVRGLNARLFAASDEKDVVFSEQVTIIGYDEQSHLLDMKKGWTIDEPLTDFRLYRFFFDIKDSSASLLSRDHFFRVTMDAIGQEPQHIDFFVKSWDEVFRAGSGITLRYPKRGQA
jgi:hypothetical protein